MAESTLREWFGMATHRIADADAIRFRAAQVAAHEFLNPPRTDDDGRRKS